MSAAPTKKTAATSKKRSKKTAALLIAGLVIFCNPCTLALGMRVGLVEAFEIDGPSMAPSYQSGDRVVVSKASLGLFLPFAREAAASWGAPELGDVVIAHSPDDIDIAKRVVGLPGDVIEFRFGELYRNGQPVARRELGQAVGGYGDHSLMRCIEERVGERRWTILEQESGMSDMMEPVRVPDGHVFLLGDNRHRSNDSRNPRIGPMPFERLKGIVQSHYLFGPDRIECPSP